MDLTRFFDPGVIAVIGASKDPAKVGHALLLNITRGTERKVFPINPKETEIMGLPCYPSVLATPEAIDLAVIAVPAVLVAGVLHECGEKKIPFAIVVSAGFKETGAEGKKLEDEIAAIAREHGIALLGPNCFGFADAISNLNTTFAADRPQKGTIAFLSQSGALGALMLNWANAIGVGFSKFVSLGNEAVLTEIELLEHLRDDENTRAILMYIEQVSDGERFVRTLKELQGKKPVAILRSGRSARGSAAARSHTGSLAPEDTVFKAACREGGAIVVDTLSEFLSLAKLFHMGLVRPVTRLAIVTNAGGPSIITADMVELSRSLSLVDLSEGVKAKLKSVLPPIASVLNPVDLIGDALASRYNDALEVLSADERIDAILAILTPQTMTQPEETARVVGVWRSRKPIIPIFIGGKAVEKGKTVLVQRGLVNFDMPDDAVRALDALAFGKKKEKKEIRTEHTAAPSVMLGFDETRGLLKAYGLEAAGVFVRTKEGLGTVGEQLHAPFAMKVVSRDVIHKTDAKGLAFGLKGKEDLERAWDTISRDVEAHVPGAVIDGFLVQEMARGKEVIIGMKRDAVFGPVIVFGLGGVFVEILKDASMRLAPIEEASARDMIQEIQAFPILAGARGERPVATAALVHIITAVSWLATEHPEITEFDLNPVIVDEERAIIADARFMRSMDGE